MVELNDLGRVFAKGATLEGERGIDLDQVFIDITKRDIEEGGFNIDITVYVRPDLQVERVMPALQRTCIDIFGHQRDDSVELFYHSGQLPNGNKLGLEVAGNIDTYKSFGVTIKHPKSRFFSLEKLKDSFTRRAYHHLQNS